MPVEIALKKIKEYLKTLHGGLNVEILDVSGVKVDRDSIKGYGYGQPIMISYRVGDKSFRVVLQTMKADHFGHEFMSDRAQSLLWAYRAYNNLPGHARAVDVGAFMSDGRLVSLGDAEEFFLVVEYIEGVPYYKDLERIRESGELSPLDLERVRTLAEYIVNVHSVRGGDPFLYVRRIRELVGHGECIMGLIDNYPKRADFLEEGELERIEVKAVRWRWKLKGRVHRVRRVHGDYHPWNVFFTHGTEFRVLDRSRGEWGEPADDISAMTINYLFFSLQRWNEFRDPFRRLWDLFFETYLDLTGDEELLEVIQPFFAWRGLVIANPIWYPTLPIEVRRKIFNFINNVLEVERFDYKDVNDLLVC